MIKRIFTLIFATVIVCASFGGFSVFAERYNINIVHTSDMAGTIFKNEEKGTVGYGNVLSVKENLGDPIVIDSGNFLGDTSQRSTGLNDKIVYVMNKAGYNYATLGYNDLKYSKAEIDTILQTANFDIISSNIMTGEEYVFETTVTKMVNGTKVGIFAVTDCESTADFQISDPETEAGKCVRQLKSGGSKVILAIVNTKNADLSKRIAQQNPDITMILESGTDNFMPSGTPEGRTLIVNPGSKGNAVGVSAVTLNNGVLQSFQTSNYNLENIKNVYPDTNSLEEEMGSAQSEIDSLNNDTVCIISEDLPYNEGESSSKSTGIGNFLADAIRSIAEADVAILRGSSIKGGLSQNVTGKEINELFEDNDDIVVKTLTGANLFKVIEIGVNKIVEGEDGQIDYEASKSEHFLQISGIKVEYNPDYKIGKRVVKIVTEDGEKIGNFSDKEYIVAGPSELFESYSEYLKGAETIERKENIIQLFREYLTESKELTADLSERVVPTDAKKSYMWIVWVVLGSFAAAAIVAYVVAQIVMILNRR